MSVAIWWIRRDLRLSDNPALAAAVAQGSVVPVFVLDPVFGGARYAPDTSRRLAFMHGGLAALARDLEAHGNRLLVLRGRPLDVLRDLVRQLGAKAIHACEDFTPYSRRRDAAVAAELPLQLHAGTTVQPVARIMTRQGKPYTVFTPFYRVWRAMPMPEPRELHSVPARIPAPSGVPQGERLLDLPLPEHFPPGETEARRRLTHFARKAMGEYPRQRDVLAAAGTSTLSPYLRFGMLSPREAAVAALSAAAAAPLTEGAEAWLRELAWRDFYMGVLYHFPQVLQGAFNSSLRDVAWRDAPADLAAWQTGRTGYPIVDACMRQLLATGWMHNRGRMIVASFLAKDLLINWQAGEAWFMQHLVDGDPAANNGGWQWAAGTGTDAAPYFRIFNPVTQGERFDPEGEFVRRWVPELTAVPTRYIHAPWTMPPMTAALCGVEIGRDYPAPVVDRAIVRERTLAAYQAAREQARV
jgi:deoxyribodipyrimidine photo-lyase